jgi:hypothetical protein
MQLHDEMRRSEPEDRILGSATMVPNNNAQRIEKYVAD